MQRSVKQPAGHSCPGDENQLLGWDYLDAFLFHIRENRLPCSLTTRGLCSFWGLWYQEEQTLASVWASEHLRTSRPNSLDECPRQGNASMELWWPQQSRTKDASWFLRIRNRICAVSKVYAMQKMSSISASHCDLDCSGFHDISCWAPKIDGAAALFGSLKRRGKPSCAKRLNVAPAPGFLGQVQIVFFSKRCEP